MAESDDWRPEVDVEVPLPLLPPLLLLPALLVLLEIPASGPLTPSTIGVFETVGAKAC